MEAEEDLPVASTFVLADGGLSARSTTARQQLYEQQQQQWLLAGDLASVPATCFVGGNLPVNNACASLVGPRAVNLAAATAASFDDAAASRTPADGPPAMPADAAASLPAGAPEAVHARAATSPSACDVAACSSSSALTRNTAHTAARKGSGAQSNEGFCAGGLNEGFHACTVGDAWWLPHSESDEWNEWEERVGVVSRVLQVLRCEGLLREARKALQSANVEVMDGEADLFTFDAKEETSKQQQHPATFSVPAAGDRKKPLRGDTVSVTAHATRGAAVVAAAPVMDPPASGLAAGGAERGRNKTFDSAGAVLADGDREASAHEPSFSCEEGAACSDVTLRLPDLHRFYWQQLRTEEPVSRLDTWNRSRARVSLQTEQDKHCSVSEGARRSVWMRGERSEADLQDDCKIRALRALIPKLVAVVPEWLDSKLDTGRRGEWLGFEKVVPSILRQRFGFTGDELRKDGPFCWRGSRRTSVTAVSPLLLLSGAAAQASHSLTCCTRYSEEARKNFHHRQQGREPEEEPQQLLHLETQGRQFQQQGVQPDAVRQQELHQSAQQLASEDVLLSAERVTLGSAEGCGRRQQLEERLPTFEAMEVDEENREHSVGNSNCRSGGDGRLLERGNGSSSRNGDVSQPNGSSPCGRQGSNTMSGESGDMVYKEEGSAIVLEVTSIWVNGFQESGKPYDVHIQAKVDGHVTCDFYIEIKATVATHPCFVLSLRQLEFAGSQGPDNYLVLVICSIRAASPAWMILNNVAERVARCLRFPLPTMADSSNQHATSTTAWSALPPDLKIRCRFEEEGNISHLAARGQLTEQGIEDILGCLLKPSPN